MLATILHRLAPLSAALLVAAPAGATGPSGATLSLRPVAVGEGGAVLLKTFRELNPDGGYAPRRAEYGWLVVSAAGTWREAQHALVDPAAVGEEVAAAERAPLQTWLEAPFDWGAPPESVRGLLREHGFAPPKEPFDPAAGKGRVTWSPKDLCVQGRCRWPAPAQRTLEELESEAEEGAPVACSFFRGGVALFRNEHGEAREVGAKFRLAPNIADYRDGFGPRDLGYDRVSVDGVVVLAPQPARGALPVRVRPDGILGDAKSPEAARRLLRGAAFPGDAGITLAKGSARRRAVRCEEFLSLVRQGFEPQNSLGIDDAGRYLVRCGGLELLSQARPSRASRVSDAPFGDRPLAALPPCVGGRHASQEAAGDAARATGERTSWADFDPRARVSEAGAATLLFGNDVFETRLSTLAWGDLDGDGLEDVLVSSATHSKEGSWRNHEFYVLTRRLGERGLRVVRDLPLRRTGGACDPNDRPWDPVPVPAAALAADPYPTPVDRWLVSWGERWGYSPADLPRPERMRGARFLRLASDGTALEVSGTIMESTAAAQPAPILSEGDGHAVHAGRWRRIAGGTLSIELQAIDLDKVVILRVGPGDGRAPEVRPPMTLTVHGRHLVGSDDLAFESLDAPVSWTSVLGQLADWSCGPLRDRGGAFPFCRRRRPGPPPPAEKERGER
ncbi:MAG: hypothetical protein WCC48_16255 [Anaeromyxobacteraceae bacterium]